MKCDQALLWTHHRQTKSPAAAALNSVPALQHSLHSWSLLAVPGPCCPPPLADNRGSGVGTDTGSLTRGGPRPADAADLHVCVTTVWSPQAPPQPNTNPLPTLPVCSERFSHLCPGISSLIPNTRKHAIIL